MLMPIYYNICAAFEDLTIFTIDYYTNVIHNLIAKENPGQTDDQLCEGMLVQPKYQDGK